MSEKLAADVLAAVETLEGQSTSAITTTVFGVGNGKAKTPDVTRTLFAHEAEGRVYHIDKKPNGRNWWLGSRPADKPCECGSKQNEYRVTGVVL